VEQVEEEREMCECFEEPGVRCPREAVMVVEEPWTPARFQLRVCRECGMDKVHGLLYHDRGPIPKEVAK